MSDYEKHIDKIRKYFEEHKAERYPFENALLREKEEYVKSLYFRMLCTLVRYTGEASEMQVLYIRRLIAGSHAEKQFQDYMKMALELDKQDIAEFLSVFAKEKLKYYFCIDGAILLTISEGTEKNYELFAELIEMLGITKKELKYLTAVAKAIIAQSSKLFDEAKEFVSETTQNLSMYHYVCGFYAGAIINTPSEIHIYSSDKSDMNILTQTFSSKKVIIENVTIDHLQEDIIFDGCVEVILRDCKIHGGEHSVKFQRVGKVVIERCEISDFSNCFAYFTDTNQIVVRGNHFLNCGCIDANDIYGGVFSCSGRCDSAVLEENELLNCYVERKPKYGGGYRITGIFLHFQNGVSSIKVFKNQFWGCKGTFGERLSYITNVRGDREEKGNICTGSVRNIFG